LRSVDLVYVHMDLNIRVRLECVLSSIVDDQLTSRYIGRGYFSRGTAGTCKFSKNHSRASVAIPVYRPIGTGLSVIHFRFRSLLNFLCPRRFTQFL